MAQEPTRYFIYARKSTDDTSRQIRSIKDQQAELWAMAHQADLDVVDVLLERQSAKQPGRPVFNDMLRRLEAGEANGILAWHPDRLSRNALDGGHIIHLVDTGAIHDLKFCTFNFEATASGKLMLGMMFSQSKYYVDNLSENIKRGIRQKLKNGIWPNRAPVGYLNDRENHTIIIDEKRAPLVKLAFEMFATGDYTLDQVRSKINNMGLVSTRGRQLSKSNYHRMFQNPVYCGLLQFDGELHQAIHEPIITKALFDKVQKVLSAKSRPQSKATKGYLYKGMFTCGECGCMITNERQKGHTYLRCTKKRGACSQRYLREEKMTEQVTETLKDIALPKEDANWMLKRLRRQQVKDRTRADLAIASIRENIADIDRQTERLQNAYLNEVVSLEEFRSTKTKLVAKRAKLKENLTQYDRDEATRLEPVEKFIKASRDAFSAAFGTNAAEKRDWLKQAGSNRQVLSGVLVFEPREAWKIVATSTLQENRRQTRPCESDAYSRELVTVPSKAVRVGFEPTVDRSLRRFSRPVRSTAPPSHRGVVGNGVSSRFFGSLSS